jgi:CDP-diacylglycerol--glycerol-3-phosphate 3-phosphatidyltransferase
MLLLVAARDKTRGEPPKAAGPPAILDCMLNVRARGPIGVIINPLVALLAKTGLTPNALTIAGAVGTVVGAALIARGELFWGVVLTTVFVLFDMVDGQLARAQGKSGPWGALLDSTLDRLSDGVIFAALVIWFGRSAPNEEPWIAGLALFCLLSGALVSYVKARAEGLGLACNVGFAERAERLIIVLVGTGLAGLGVAYVMAAALWFLAAASVVTIGQRLAAVRRQVVALEPR